MKMAFKCMFPGAKYLTGEQSKQVCNENSENVDAVLERIPFTVCGAGGCRHPGDLLGRALCNPTAKELLPSMC